MVPYLHHCTLTLRFDTVVVTPFMVTVTVILLLLGAGVPEFVLLGVPEFALPPAPLAQPMALQKTIRTVRGSKYPNF